jgi:trigger factor
MSMVTRENIGLLNDKIIVKVGQDDYLPSFQKALKDYSKKANIPGFRKGMVPAGLIKKMYGNSVFADEVLKSVEKKLTEYMASEKLDIFAQPLPMPENDASQLQMNKPEEYSFAFEVGLKPNFELPDPGSFPLTKYAISVTDEMVQEEVERLRLRHGKMTEPEAVASDDNVVSVTFTESDQEGNPVSEANHKENSLLVSYFSPLFREQLLGKKKDDSLVLQLGSAFEEKEKEWIAKDLGFEKDDPALEGKYFKMLITKVGLMERAAVDEPFFEAVFPGKEIRTEEAFRTEIRHQIQESWNQQAKSQLQHSLYHELLDRTKIEFPESFLKRWLRNGGEKSKSPEEVEEEFPSFTNQLKWTLIVDKVARDNNLEISPDDLKAHARQQLLGYMGTQASAEEQPWIADYVQRMMQDRRFVEDTVHRLQTDKTLAWAESMAKPAEKNIGRDEFVKMQEEHQHHHH